MKCISPLLAQIVIVIVMLTTSWAQDKQSPGAPANFKSTLVKASDLGEDWTESGGSIIIEDTNSKSPKLPQAVIDQYKNLGVVSLATLPFRKKSNPLHQVELKIFVFESKEKRESWTDKKYGYEGWEKHYKKSISGDSKRTTWDSTQIKKQIIAFDNYWITSSTITSTDDHITLITECIEKLSKQNAE